MALGVCGPWLVAPCSPNGLNPTSRSGSYVTARLIRGAACLFTLARWQQRPHSLVRPGVEGCRGIQATPRGPAVGDDWRCPCHPITCCLHRYERNRSVRGSLPRDVVTSYRSACWRHRRTVSKRNWASNNGRRCPAQSVLSTVASESATINRRRPWRGYPRRCQRFGEPTAL